MFGEEKYLCNESLMVADTEVCNSKHFRRLLYFKWNKNDTKLLNFKSSLVGFPLRNIVCLMESSLCPTHLKPAATLFREARGKLDLNAFFVVVIAVAGAVAVALASFRQGRPPGAWWGRKGGGAREFGESGKEPGMCGKNVMNYLIVGYISDLCEENMFCPERRQIYARQA